MCEGIVKKSELMVWSGSSPPECCAICREVFQVGVDICRVLDCTHVFHAKCIDLWFVKASSCPLCKNDLKICGRNSSSQRSLGRSSQSSSQMSLGSVSLRSGQILVGHSNSDPALLRTLYREAGPLPRSQTPDRHLTSSTPSLHTHDRSMDVISMSRSERSLALLSESSSGLLPAVQEGSEEARFEESLPMDSSNPNSARTAGQTSSSEGSRSRSRSEGAVQFSAPTEMANVEELEDEAPRNEVDEKPMTWRVFAPEQSDPCRAPVFGQPVPQRVALPVHATAWSLTLPSSASHRKLVGPPTSISLTMEVTNQARSTNGGAQTVQLPRHLDGAMKRSLSQAQEAETGPAVPGAGAGQGQIPVPDRDDRLVASTNTVMYSARPMVAPPPCTLNRPSHAPQTFRVAGPHPSHAGYRPMTVAFHGFQVATRRRSPGMTMVPPSVRWV